MKRFFCGIAIGILLLLYGGGRPSVYAVDCTRPISGSMTISSSCSFPATVDGVDAGTGSSNTADVTVSSGTLTIAAGQTISTGRLIPSGGNIVVLNTGQIKIGSPIWVTDEDADGYPASTTQVVQADAPTNGRRRNLMTSLTSIDCRDANASAVSCDPVSASLTTGINNRTFDAGSATIESNYHELPADINTVGLWHMNEGTGTTTADSSGNSNTGTLATSPYNPTWQTAANSKLGASSLNFDGINDYVIVSDSSSLDVIGDLTIEAWVYPRTTGVGQIVSKWYNQTSYLLDGGDSSMTLYLESTCAGNGGKFETVTNPFPTLNTWYHVAAVYSASAAKVRFYINGSLTSSTTHGTIPSSLCNSNEPLSIGAYKDGTLDFKGAIDELRISNIARTPEEVKADAQRFPYSVYTSLAFDLGQTPITWTQLNYSVKGARTGDGETPVSTNSLVAQWNFNETSGTTAVSGGSCGTSCNGTLTTFASTSSQDQAAGTGWTANNKRWGAGALMFDGTNDYVTMGNSLLASATTFTAETWIKTTDTGTYRRILTKGLWGGTGYGFLIRKNDSNKASFNVQTCTEIASTKTITDGNWHHIIGVQTATQNLLYVDGNLENSTTCTQTLTTTDNFQISGYNGATGEIWNGTIDATRIYSRALSAGEILANYNAGNIELQTRTSADNSTWEAWKPVTGETQIDSMDAVSPSAGLTSGQQLLCDSGTVSLWHMNETSGTGVADSCSSNNGTATGTTIVASRTANFGNARSFNGTSDYINAGSASSVDNLFVSPGGTFEMWIYPRTNNGSPIFFSKGIWYVFLSTNNVMTFGYDWSTASPRWTTPSNSITLNAWNHIVVTYNNSSASNNATIYINGVSQSLTSTDTPPTGSPVSDASSTLIIGALNGSSNFFDGLIDEVRISNVARTANEIQQNYYGNPKAITSILDTTTKIEGSGAEKLQIGAPQVDANTVGLWHMDETSGTSAYIKDATANANNGTPTGTTVVDGFYGKARSFNGSGDYIEVPARTWGVTGNFTVSAWIYFTASSNFTYQVWGLGNGTDYLNDGKLTVYDDGASYIKRVSFLFYGNTGGSTYRRVYSTNNAVIPNAWNYVVGVMNNNQPYVYANGVDVSSVYDGGGVSLTDTSRKVWIGTDKNMDAKFNGKIDEVQFSNTVRTAEEIAEAYRAGRDHRVSRGLTSTDLSGKSKLPFYVASDRPGTFLEAAIGESAYANYEPDANTVGLWHLEEQTGTANTYIKDSSGYGHNSSSISGTTFIQAKIGKGRNLASTNYIDFGDHDDFEPGANENFIAEAWYKHSGTTRGVILDKQESGGNDWEIMYLGGGSPDILRAGIRGSTTPVNLDYTNAAVHDGNWHYVVFARNASNNTVSFYFDGQLVVGPSSFPGTDYVNNTRPFRLGYSAYALDNAINNIDEVRISNTARTPDEIRQAYEIGKRTHPITIDFVTSPQAAYTSGTSVTVNNPWGTTNLTDTLHVGDTIIFKENVNGTETVGQAAVTAITNTSSTYGTVTVDAAPSFPSGGYSTNAKVFKWQREYMDLTGSLTTHRDAITRLTMRVTDGSQGANVWLDDFKSNTNYLTNTCGTPNLTSGVCTNTITGASVTSSLNRYMQFRAIIGASDPAVSPSLTGFSVEYQ